MSYLVKEDDEFLHLYRYLHDDPDEYPKWVFGEDNKFKYSDRIVEADGAAAYELRLDYRIRKSNAEVIIDSIK
jgi:hypothetical protein